MTKSRSQGATAMTTVDCPWCNAPAQVAETSIHCPGCAVTVELVTETANRSTPPPPDALIQAG